MSTPQHGPGDDEARERWEEMLRQFGFGAGQMPDLGALMGALQGQMSAFTRTYGEAGDGAAANWAVTKDAARKTAALAGPDPHPDAEAAHAVREAGDIADQWLADATVFDPLPGHAEAWSRAQWVEATMPTWQRLITPVVTSIANALAGLLREGPLGADEGAAQFQQMFAPMLRQAAAAMFGAQAGQSIGQVATDVVSVADLGLPMPNDPAVALLPTNITTFADGLEVPERDIRIYLALRETARQRLFAAVPWLATQLLALVEHYAREIHIDTSALQDAVADMEQLDPAALQELSDKVNGTLFEPATTAEQREVLARLETLVALVEGWVDDVVAEAAGRWLPSLGALTEAVRRRRAEGGPAEAALKALVGLELRPRRVRDAANLWAAIRSARGVGGRDEVWRHPDLLPTERDLDDPLGYVSGDKSEAAEDDLDAELRRLLSDEG